MRVIDVGANLGFYTLLMADLVGPSGHVHAFEPTPRVASRLAKSVDVNGFGGRVRLHAAPVTERPGDLVELFVPRSDPSHAAICPAGSRQPALGDEVVALHTVTIDDVIGDESVDFIKVDAEGAEFAIWRGMRRLIARNGPLVLSRIRGRAISRPSGLSNGDRRGRFQPGTGRLYRPGRAANGGRNLGGQSPPG